jgi:hypothetical protein
LRAGAWRRYDCWRLLLMWLDLAIVIPVGPGDTAWRQLLPQLADWPVRELLLVFADGQLPDAPGPHTLDPRTLDPRTRAVSAPRGRASQQNRGAALSSARWLWFLHADSRLSPAALGAIAKHVQGDERALGYFDLRFLDDGPALMALNSIGAWLRSRCLHLPFGDQGFVLSRALFDELGGFDHALSSGEDHDLVWRARAAGAAIRPIRAALHTSARKYAQLGWWRTTLLHLRTTASQARVFARKAGLPK